jgi:thiaminase
MGAVFRAKDFGSNYKKIIDNSMKDLQPDAKNDVYKLFNTWEGKSSEEKLIKNLDTLNENEKEDLKNIFKDSLTFD